MSTFGDIFVQLFGVWKDMFSGFIGILPKVFSVLLWVLSAIIILPCVFIAGQIYPKWVEWGEDF